MATGCTAPDRPVLRARRIAPRRARSRAERRLLAHYARVTQLGVLPEPAVPLTAILIAIPAALVLANLIAAAPGQAAARTQPAAILRAE